MPYANYNYNPYAWSNPYAQYPQQITPTPPQPNNGIKWVQGEAGAKAYPVSVGESVFLMDSENPMAYLKTTDQSGMPTMKYYTITEVSPETLGKETKPKADYATQDDLAKVRDDISKLRKALKNLQTAYEGESNE